MRKNYIFTLIGSLGLTCLVLTSVRPLPMQEDDGIHWLPNKVGKWIPRPMNVDDVESRQNYDKLTQREFDTYIEKMQRLAAITRELKVLNPPIGVDAYNNLSILSPPYSDVQKPRSYIPVVGLVRFGLYPYYMGWNGQIDTNPDNSAWLAFYINNLLPIFRGERYTNNGVVEDWVPPGEPAEMEDEQGLYFLAPKVVGDLQGFPIYDTAVVIVVKSQKPLWVPVSQERFLRNAIRRAQEFLEAQEKDKKEMLEHMPPDMVSQAEKDWRDAQEGTRALLAEYPGDIRFLRADYVKALTQELASLSPEQRAAQAYYCQDWKTTRRPSGLLDPGSPKARPVVSPNPDFFNPALPRTAIQVIVVLHISLRQPDLAHPEKANPAVVRHFEVQQTLDWKKVAALVE